MAMVLNQNEVNKIVENMPPIQVVQPPILVPTGAPSWAKCHEKAKNGGKNAKRESYHKFNLKDISNRFPCSLKQDKSDKSECPICQGVKFKRDYDEILYVVKNRSYFDMKVVVDFWSRGEYPPMAELIKKFVMNSYSMTNILKIIEYDIDQISMTPENRKLLESKMMFYAEAINSFGSELKNVHDKMQSVMNKIGSKLNPDDVNNVNNTDNVDELKLTDNEINSVLAGEKTESVEVI